MRGVAAPLDACCLIRLQQTRDITSPMCPLLSPGLARPIIRDRQEARLRVTMAPWKERYPVRLDLPRPRKNIREHKAAPGQARERLAWGRPDYRYENGTKMVSVLFFPSAIGKLS
jgi:hypothetical protein